MAIVEGSLIFIPNRCVSIVYSCTNKRSFDSRCLFKIDQVPAMSNAFEFVLDDASVRRAVVEGLPETVMAAIYRS